MTKNFILYKTIMHNLWDNDDIDVDVQDNVRYFKLNDNTYITDDITHKGSYNTTYYFKILTKINNQYVACKGKAFIALDNYIKSIDECVQYKIDTIEEFNTLVNMFKVFKI